jgi:hypothetical protein
MEEVLENSNSTTETPENTNSQNSAPEQKEGESADEYTEREKQYYARIKKLEEENKVLKQSKDATPLTGISDYDVLAIKNSNITEKEDLQTVKDLAKRLGISVADALEDKYVRNVLADRAEERRTARATETRSPRGIAKNSGEDILRKAESTGEVPDSPNLLRDLAQARLDRRMKK